MSSWSSQAGFPLLTVTRNYDSGSASQVVTLAQQRYMPDSNNATYNESWWIPINYVTESNPNFEDTQPIQWYPQHHEQDTFTIDISTLTEGDWLMINVQETGYFRILYDEQNYKLLSDAMLRDITQFHMLNRAQLIDDTYNLVQTGHLEYDTFFDVVRFLEYDNEYAVWYPAITAFTEIELRFTGSEQYQLFRVFMNQAIINPQ